jgi:very-short-patch-repair endonuclease
MTVVARQPHSVHARRTISTDLTRLAELQAGVITTEQAVALGQSRHSLARLVQSGQWLRLTTGVYLTVPAAVDFAVLAWGGVLLGGDGARLGPYASGFLHRLLDASPEVVDVLVPADRRVRVDGPWQFIRERCSGRSARTVGSPPRLVLEETVIDLTNQSRDVDVVSLVTRAVQTRGTTAARLATALARRERHRHRALLHAMLSDVAVGAESALELMYLREVERPHGLPVGKRQRSRLGLPYCTDVGYDEYRLLVELDGRDGHEGIGRFRDMRRDNRFVTGGFTTFRFGFFDVLDHPCAVAGQVWAVLAERGRSETFRHCSRCLNAPLSELVRG